MTENTPSNNFHWLFVGAQPSSGSTLLAQLLGTAAHTARLEPRSEGQWLVPELVAGENRWAPDAALPFDALRRVWLNAAADTPDDRRIIVEKSPPNLCRMRRLIELFSDMPHTLVLLVRDPYAICVSWANRYSLPEILEEWRPDIDKPVRNERDTCFLLGRICGQRFRLQRDLLEMCDCVIAYEELTANPPATMQKIVDACPGIGPLDFDDPAFTEIRNRNPGLLARLSPDARRWMTEALMPFETEIAAFGYTLDPDPTVSG